MPKLKTLGAAAVLTLVTALGCGGDADDDGGSGGLPDSTVLGTLTDSQSETLCSDTEAFVTRTELREDSQELACRIQGFLGTTSSLPTTDAALQASCQAGYDSCVAAATPPGPVSCMKPTAACLATVGEYKACLGEADAETTKALALLPPCDELTRTKWASLIAGAADLIPPLPACSTLEEKCPEIDIPIPEIPGL